MKKNSLLLLATCLSLASFAQEPLWMRQPAISPDGSTLVFSYKGDLYTVSTQGGRATQITSNPAYECKPTWSPNGQNIAFLSNREGAMNLYTINKDGRDLRRLTTLSSTLEPMTYLNDSTILATGSIMPSNSSSQFPGFPLVYTVDARNGQYKLLYSHSMEMISIDPSGDKWLYTDYKGYEDPWRKHHTSSITRDLWMLERGANKFSKLTTFKGEDRNAVWAPDGKAFYYLSEENGSFNIFKMQDGQSKTLTQFKKHPLRFLSIAKNGTMAFFYDGQIYTYKEGGQAQKLNIEIVRDGADREKIDQNLSSGITALALAPEGKEVALVVRGDVFVTSSDYSTTRRITNTAEQERGVEFSPDGRKMIYSAERNGNWNVYMAEIVRPEDKSFTYASEIKETQLTSSKSSNFQAEFSPDGKKIAFLENRTTLRIMDLQTKAITTALDGQFNYSYSDGDQYFSWSPDSRWLLCSYIAVGGWNNRDVALVKADGTEVHNLTNSGYTDYSPKWVLGGKAMIWVSDRAGYRSHGSWGAESDWYIMCFDDETWQRFKMSPEDLALLEEREKAEKKADEAKADEDKNKGKGKDKKEDAKKEEVKALTFDLENTRYRTARLTPNSSFVGDAILSEKGDKLFYFSSFEGKADLWMRELKTGNTKLVIKGTGYCGLASAPKCKFFAVVSNGQLQKLDTGSLKLTPISFRAEFEYKPAAERQYIFDHAWQQVKEKFYDTTLHGVDWEALKVDYARFLPHINNNFDYAELLSEILGELNASHTGGRYFYSPSYQTAALGIFWEEKANEKGILVQEIIKRSPLSLETSKVKEGMMITKIDGVEIDHNLDQLLRNKAGKNIRLTVFDPATKTSFETQIKAINRGEQSEYLYRRWVENRKKLVDSLSGGKLAYVHVRGMNSTSFREVYSELLSSGNRSKLAAIVDTRHNGGGWLHDDLATLLSGKVYETFEPRGQYIGSDPFNKWCKPSAVIMGENNYSNGHGFPYVYKTLGIGKLIGAPVPGTMTAVWWENQIDPSIVFGIPQVTCKDTQGRAMENLQLEPDILIYNTPESMMKGDDPQIAAAVKHLLEITK